VSGPGDVDDTLSNDCPHEEHRAPWWRGEIVEEPRSMPESEGGGWEITMRVLEASDPKIVGQLRVIHRDS
jgi:hypothetical protein